jgi:5'-nucleotidase
MGERPLILITNDDGVFARGIEALARAAEALGDVVVFAPDRNRSGVSHMISLMAPLRVGEVRPRVFQTEGTPADCVYLAVHGLLDRKPSLVLSGVNAGPNLSFDVHYSGTVGGAIEGTLLGIPSIAVSLTDPVNGSFELAAEFTARIAKTVLERGLPSTSALNINVPGGRPSRYQMTFLGHRLFKHSVHKRDDPRGTPYYWIGGEPAAPRDIPGSDCNAIAEGIISVTPLLVDMTNVRALEQEMSRFDVDGVERAESVAPPRDLELWPVE